jgi:NAD(P)-dependent dehydrogenase (short-subunit alcohol dehydrogenase family)
MKPLKNKVAVVAGATRGAGRGIARGLGEAGATVYCTGRSVRGNPSPYGRPETIEETAEMVSAAGGAGLAVRVDHTVESEVRALFERVEAERGRLDVLANSVAGEDPRLGGWTSFWETDLSQGLEVLRHAVLAHVITAKYAAPLMIRKRRGLLVEVTEGDCFLGGSGNVLHDLAKASIKELAYRMAEELRKHRVAAVAITPGFLRTESMLEHFGVTEANWREGGKKDQNFLESESPLFLGRAVAALAQDRKVLARSGDLTSSWELAREYGFNDADGRRPDGGKHFEKVLPSVPGFREGMQRQIDWLERIAGRARRYLGQGCSPVSSPARGSVGAK